jgi:hypothetical protein
MGLGKDGIMNLRMLSGASEYKFLLIIIIILLIIVPLFIPVKLPYSISAYCKIQPAKKWVLTVGANGQLLAVNFDYKEGVSDGIRATQFAREGTMNLKFDSLITSGSLIKCGDTIATIYSSETVERLAELTGQAAIMRASLASNTTGDKQSIISEFESKVIHAEEAASNQQLIVNRLKTLLDKNLVSQQEFEIAEGQQKLLGREIDIAKSQLESARTGVKPQEAELIKFQIAALEKQIDALNKRIESFSIISPISGTVSRSYSSDTLLVISDATEFVAIIPVKSAEFSYTSIGQEVSVFYNGTRDITGRIIHLGNEIHTMKGQQTRYCTALINNYTEDLPSGILSKCRVSCRPVTIIEYLRRFLLS